MKKRALIHIGPPKTASTTIQNALHRNRDLLGSHSIAYPVFEGQTRQMISLLFEDFHRLPVELQHRVKSPDRLPAVRSRVQAQFERQLEGRRDLLCSAEDFGVMSFEGVRKFRQFLKARGYNEFLIIAVYRDPADRFLSTSGQRVKRHPFLRKFQRQSTYERMGECWRPFFPGALELLPLKSEEGDVLARFRQRLDRFFEVETGSKWVDEPRTNESFPAEASIAMQRLQQRYFERPEPNLPDMKTHLIRATVPAFLSKLPEDAVLTKPTLRPEIAEALRALYQDEVKGFATEQSAQQRSPDTKAPFFRLDRIGTEIVDFEDLICSFNEETVTQLMDAASQSFAGEIEKRSTIAFKWRRLRLQAHQALQPRSSYKPKKYI